MSIPNYNLQNYPFCIICVKIHESRPSNKMAGFKSFGYHNNLQSISPPSLNFSELNAIEYVDWSPKNYIKLIKGLSLRFLQLHPKLMSCVHMSINLLVIRV